ncbi:MAG: hypothetical protein WKG07_27000 [Hymenobacter sp.]
MEARSVRFGEIRNRRCRPDAALTSTRPSRPSGLPTCTVSVQLAQAAGPRAGRQ